VTALLQGEGLALVRGGRLLFEGLDIQLGAGDALHLTGPNGCGKSSLIRLVAGLLSPNEGRVERADAALADDALALDRELPLARALAFWNGPRLAEAMSAFGLDHLADVPVRLLSTGQGRRARLARVMASGASLWLLDEPLNGLDRDGAERLAAAISAHRNNGGGVLAASHLPLGDDWRTLELGR
jgi:heme exporter protein A